MINPWAMKMEQFTRFTDEERRRLDEFIGMKHQRRFRARQDFITEGAHAEHCYVLLTGIACRYKILPEGERQIMAFLLPGDLCDAEIFVLNRMDHSVGTLAASRAAILPAETMRLLLREASSITEGLWWGTMTDLGVLRERILDLGRRDATERLAHLFYEMLIRYRIVGEAEDNSFVFPITQTDIADAIGLTPSHINRVLQRFRDSGIIELHNRMLKITNPRRLKEMSQFDASYLHLDRTKGQ